MSWVKVLRRVSGWRLPLQALIVALGVVAARLMLDAAGAERISVSTLIGSIITANVFIIGFLLTGVISDYKESEKLPGDLAVSIGTIADECLLLWRRKGAEPARDCVAYLQELTASALHWFYKEERTQVMMDKLRGLGDHLVGLEPFTQANYIVRMKQEQTAVSRMLTRIHTIRETSFVASGYTMAQLATTIVLAGLLFIKVDPWYESVFLVGLISWFLSYLLLLIRDLDNPFEYHGDGKAKGQEVSLKPLLDLRESLAQRLSERPAAGSVHAGVVS